MYVQEVYIADIAKVEADVGRIDGTKEGSEREGAVVG